MKTYAILLRGVMPTGKNRVPMANLRAALAGAGLAGVQTCIQSGHVVAQSALHPSALETMMHQVIADEMGADITVVVRTHEQIRQVLEGNPFPTAVAARTYFTLLASRPIASLVQDLRQVDFAPDEVRVTDAAIYTLYATRHSDSTFNNTLVQNSL